MAFPPMRAPRPAARLLLALGGILLGCGRPHPPQDPAILELGDHAIRQSEFVQYVATVEAQGGAPLDPRVRAALKAFIVTVLGGMGSVLYQRDSNPIVERMIEQRREAIGVDLVPREGGMRALIRELGSGRSVGLVVDNR